MDKNNLVFSILSFILGFILAPLWRMSSKWVDSITKSQRKQ